MAEARYLASQLSRTRVLQESAVTHRKRRDDLNSFWNCLRAYFVEWNQRLDDLAERHGNAAVETEEDKGLVRMELCRLRDELKAVRKQCINSNSTAESPHAAESVTPRFSFDLPEDVDMAALLPISDVRILHLEFSKQQDKLDQIKAKLLPKGKFIFRRYREALQRQEEAAKQQPHPSYYRAEGTKTLPSSLNTTRRPLLATNSLENIDGKKVILDENGNLTVQPREEMETSMGLATFTSRWLSTEGEQGSYPALALLNIENSSVEMYVSLGDHLRLG